jgi:hypothetical protein
MSAAANQPMPRARASLRRQGSRRDLKFRSAETFEQTLRHAKNVLQAEPADWLIMIEISWQLNCL